MIPISALLVAQALEDAMPLKPRIKVKAKGIPIGSYDVIADAAGKQVVKPKRKRKPLPQKIASRKKQKWRAAK